MSELDALMAAIRAAPNDDLPRLVYADKLDDLGLAERAEFVRLQVAIAAAPPRRYNRLADRHQADEERRWRRNVHWEPPPGNGTSTGVLYWDEPDPALEPHRRRAEELLTSYWRLWADAIRYDVQCEGTGPYGVQSGSVTTTISFERGFIHTVHTTLGAFYGWEERCGDHCGLGVMDPETGVGDCRRCDDTGWVFHGGFARELFRQHPVATLSLTDVRPVDDDGDGLFGFRSRHRSEPEQVELGEVTEDSVDEYSDLPLRLWELLGEDDDPRQDRTGLGSGWKLFRTHDRATERLGYAVLNLGRELAV